MNPVIDLHLDLYSRAAQETHTFLALVDVITESRRSWWSTISWQLRLPFRPPRSRWLFTGFCPCRSAPTAKMH